MQITDSFSDRTWQTREKLIRAGLELFSKDGLDGVRTRQLAQTAGVNQSTIPYHFGGKDGLYLAVLEHVADSIVGHLELPRSCSARDSPEKILHVLMQDFVCALLGAPTSKANSLLLAREQLNPGRGFDILYTRFFQPLHQTVSQLLVAIRGVQTEDKSTIFCAHAILGQALAFAVARETLLRRLGENALSSGEIMQIADMVGTLSVATARHQI